MAYNAIVIKELAKDVIYLLMNERRFCECEGVITASDNIVNAKLLDVNSLSKPGYTFRSLLTLSKGYNIIIISSDDDYPRVIMNNAWKSEHEKSTMLDGHHVSPNSNNNIYVAVSDSCLQHLLLNQFVFQFSHELTHLIIGYYDSTSMQSDTCSDSNNDHSKGTAEYFVEDYHSNFLIEVIAVAVSMITLELISEAWKTPWMLPLLNESISSSAAASMSYHNEYMPISHESKIQYAPKYLQYQQQVIQYGLESNDTKENELYACALKARDMLRSCSDSGKSWKALRRLGEAVILSHKMLKPSECFDIWMSMLQDKEKDLVHELRSILIKHII